MTAPAGIESVLARISQIQSQMTTLLSTVAPASTAATSSTSGADFSAALASAQQTGATSLTGVSGNTGSVTGAAVVASAEKYLGVPYVWGGTTAQGLDCSGLVQKAYGDLGIQLPRIAADQAKSGTPVASLADAQPGDLLGFGSPAYHIAIYLGNNQMIAAPEAGENVKIQSVYQTPDEIRRIVPANTTSAPSLSGLSALTGIPALTASSGTSLSSGVAQFAAQFASAEQSYKLPAGLLAAVAQAESGGDVNAVSPAGAQGLMQMMPTTASALGINPFDATQSIDGAARMLSGYLTNYNGSVPLALAAYNAGPGAVAQYGGVPPYTETQNYVRKITGLMAGGA